MINMLITLLSLALVAGGQSTTKPNFSGEWKMNAAKSDFGPVPVPEFITRSITHAEPALTIVEEQRPAMGAEKVIRKYITDGTEGSFDSNGTMVKSKASWSGDTLVVVSSVDVVGLTFNDTMTLSADGKTLTSVVLLNSPQGELTITIVFEKQ